MTTKEFALTATALTLLAGFGWQMMQRGRWQERRRDLQAQIDSTHRLLASYRVDSLRRTQVLDSLAQRTVRLTQDSLRWASRYSEVTRKARASDSVLARLQAAVNEDSLPRTVRNLLTAKQEALQTAREGWGACEEGLRLAQDQRSACQMAQDTLLSEIVALRGLQVRLGAERDSALALLRPPSLLSLQLSVGIGVACVYRETLLCGPSVHVTLLRLRLPLF